MRSVFIETLGCQMNRNDSELMLGLLAREGFRQAANPREADLVVLNSCQIRAQAEDKAYSYLGHWNTLKKHRPDLKIALTGCVAQQTGENAFRAHPASISWSARRICTTCPRWCAAPLPEKSA